VGLVLFSLDYGLIYWGEQYLDSGLTAILFATMPLFTGLFSSLAIPAERLTARQFLGILLGGIGLGLVFQASLSVAPGDLGPMAAIVVSAAAAGSASVVVRRWGRGIPVASLNGYAMLIGAIVLTCSSLIAGERQGLPTEAAGWWSLLYLALLGSVVTFLLYLWLLRHWSANRSSFVALATPVVAVLAGVAVRAERLTLVQVFGAALVLAGVAVAVYARSATQPPLEQEKVGEEEKEESKASRDRS
jgi:drug/metabolite transporter (DMT)-like permease